LNKQFERRKIAKRYAFRIISLHLKIDKWQKAFEDKKNYIAE
jgi:hypothetical protein